MHKKLVIVAVLFMLVFKIPLHMDAYLDGEEKEKAIVYILPYEKCNDYWSKTYGDRIYYYVYGNVSKDREAIEKDFRIISRFYEIVILIIPADDRELYFKNMKMMDKIASENGLHVIYAIFPKEKYGREDTYIDSNTKMHFLVLQDMKYLASLNSTYKVAIWYGWEYRCNAKDIVSFYNSLPNNLKGIYAIWLDEEYATKVRNVYSYGLPYDVLFITEAYDYNEIKTYSCLYYNQMLVTGYEGAPSLEKWRENIEYLLSVCKCKNVGIWIFYDIGDGAGEEYAAFIDGGLAAFNYSYEVPFQKGFSYAAWWNDTFMSPDSDASLRNLRETGTDFVSIVPTWYQEDERSPQILPDRDATPSDESIVHAIKFAHSMGMKVMLKPHVDLYNGGWRGEISFDNQQDWKKWFSNYKNFILHYARIAQQNNVEIFSVGCEYVKTVGREEWFDIISAVRNEYTGLLTYASNWDNYKNVSFWNALDFIGIDAYFWLTHKNDPSLDELINAWKRWKKDIEYFHNETGKPIVFTEIGYRSIDGCNRDPWNWQRHGKIDLQEQADCYKAAFITFWNEPWFYGFYWWMWYPNTSIGGSNDDSYTPYKKPAEKILKEYYIGINLSVEIIKPKNGYLYIFDREIMSNGKTIVIGKITIEAKSNNASKVEFYIDGKLKHADDMPPYKWQWNEMAIGWHEIKVIAYGINQKAEDDRQLWIFNL